MENREVNDFIMGLHKSVEIADDFVEKLPEDVALALSTISVVIDKYAAKIGRSSFELWFEMNNAALFVHEEFGNYKEDQE